MAKIEELSRAEKQEIVANVKRRSQRLNWRMSLQIEARQRQLQLTQEGIRQVGKALGIWYCRDEHWFNSLRMAKERRDYLISDL